MSSPVLSTSRPQSRTPTSHGTKPISALSLQTKAQEITISLNPRLSALSLSWQTISMQVSSLDLLMIVVFIISTVLEYCRYSQVMSGHACPCYEL